MVSLTFLLVRSNILSALTKILIVLISLLSIFLCAVASTYVGTSVNWKQKASELSGDIKTLEAEKTVSQSLFDSQSILMKANHEKLQEKYAQQVRLNSDLKTELTTEKRSSLESDKDRSKFLVELTALRKTIESVEMSLDTTRDALTVARKEGVKNRTELTQLTDKLLEELVKLEHMEVQFKRLLEEKTELESRFTASGTEVPKVTPVTPEIGPVLPANTSQVAPRGGLRGLVIEVKGSLATISIGAADGVKKKDVLHISRGSEFICDIVITDVDTNKAAGILELVQQGGPKIGDTVTSEL